MISQYSQVMAWSWLMKTSTSDIQISMVGFIGHRGAAVDFQPTEFVVKILQYFTDSFCRAFVSQNMATVDVNQYKVVKLYMPWVALLLNKTNFVPEVQKDRVDNQRNDIKWWKCIPHRTQLTTSLCHSVVCRCLCESFPDICLSWGPRASAYISLNWALHDRTQLATGDGTWVI